MFTKNIYTVSTGEQYEKARDGGYYVIWEIGNRRPIDEDHYELYLDWIALGNTPATVDVTPAVVEQIDYITVVERLDAIEGAFLDYLLTVI